MPNPNRMSPAAVGALAYITAGSLIVVWSAVGLVYTLNHPLQDDRLYYVGAGIAGTGVALLVIGLAIGGIGRGARRADLPPVAAPPAVAPPVAVQPPHRVAIQPTAVAPPASPPAPPAAPPGSPP